VSINSYASSFQAINISTSDNYWSSLLTSLEQGSIYPSRFNFFQVPKTEKLLLKYLYLQQKIIDLLTNGCINELCQLFDAQIFTHSFRDFDNHSAINITFIKKRYEVFVWLKTMGFVEFENEDQCEIADLPNTDQTCIRAAMINIVHK